MANPLDGDGPWWARVTLMTMLGLIVGYVVYSDRQLARDTITGFVEHLKESRVSLDAHLDDSRRLERQQIEVLKNILAMLEKNQERMARLLENQERLLSTQKVIVDQTR